MIFGGWRRSAGAFRRFGRDLRDQIRNVWNDATPLLRGIALVGWFAGAFLAGIGTALDGSAWWMERPFLVNLSSSMTAALFGIPLALLILQGLSSQQAEIISDARNSTQLRRAEQQFRPFISLLVRQLLRTGVGELELATIGLKRDIVKSQYDKDRGAYLIVIQRVLQEWNSAEFHKNFGQTAKECLRTWQDVRAALLACRVPPSHPYPSTDDIFQLDRCLNSLSELFGQAVAETAFAGTASLNSVRVHHVTLNAFDHTQIYVSDFHRYELTPSTVDKLAINVSRRCVGQLFAECFQLAKSNYFRSLASE